MLWVVAMGGALDLDVRVAVVERGGAEGRGARHRQREVRAGAGLGVARDRAVAECHRLHGDLKTRGVVMFVMVTNSRPDCKHQSASHKHGHQAEHGARRMVGGVRLRNTREMVQKNVKF